MTDQSVGADVFFVLMGAILVFAMHGGFAFLEVGTVRQKSQVNALVKIIVDFAISTTAYFAIGYTLAYGLGFFQSASTLVNGELYGPQGLLLVKFFFLATFAAAVPAIISGGIAERMKFLPQCVATALIVALVYPISEGAVWGGAYGIQSWFEATFGAPFRDFAGSIVVHGVGGFIALAAVLRLGPRLGRYGADGPKAGFPPSSIPWLALGSWMLCIGWFGFNVMSAQALDGVSRTGGDEFVDGHGRRHPGCDSHRQKRSRIRSQRSACGSGRGVCRIRHHASGGKLHRRRRCWFHLRQGPSDLPVPPQDRRCPRSLAPPRPVRAVGWRRRGHIWRRSAGWTWRSQFRRSTAGLAAGGRLRVCRRPDRLLDHRGNPRASPLAGGGAPWRGQVDPQHQRQSRSGHSGLIDAGPRRDIPAASLFLRFSLNIVQFFEIWGRHDALRDLLISDITQLS